MSTIATKLTRGSQLLASTLGALLRRDLTLADLVLWWSWKRARRRIPRSEVQSNDKTDGTVLVTVWAEVFLPYPPNGHAYELGPCRIEQGTWVIDAGACEGFFVSYALRRGARVLAVEPVPRLAYCLEKTFESEVKKGNVTVINALLGSTVAQGRINVVSSPVSAHSSADQGEPVRATTIDTLLDNSVVPTVDFIKMDIEGSEVSALSGARMTLVRHQPNLSLAAYHNATDERRLRQLLMTSGVEYQAHAKGLIRNKGRLVHQILHAWPRLRPMSPRHRREPPRH
ncbi:MAG: FkbM family methyltransferase [Chloroflexi bacterium]|nr:MAG: FkbM family methyltransferase [Chloroflexota bacterium]